MRRNCGAELRAERRAGENCAPNARRATRTVIIWSSWVREVRPSGYMMKHSTFFLPRSPWIADEPVSPDVAPRTVMRMPGRSSRSASKRLPRNWRATSLKAKVGPWYSSSTCMLSPGSSRTGVTRPCLPSVWSPGVIGSSLGGRKVPYERLMMSLSFAAGITSSVMYLDITPYATSSYVAERHDSSSAAEILGRSCGTKRPPSAPSPCSTALAKSTSFWAPRVVRYLVVDMARA